MTIIKAVIKISENAYVGYTLTIKTSDSKKEFKRRTIREICKIVEQHFGLVTPDKPGYLYSKPRRL